MAESADVVVVGGGVQGVTLALHLLDAGVKDVRLVERDETFQGSSAAAAGFLAYWAMEFPQHGEEEIAVERYGLQYYRDLHESGYDIDFVQNGLLIVTDDEQIWPEIERYAVFDGCVGNRAVDADAIADLTAGLIKAGDSMRGVFHPPGAQLFSTKLGRALTDRLLKRGGVIDERRPITDLVVKKGRVTGVKTSWGSIKTDTVILATGAWTNQILRSLDVYLPMIPRVTSRMITEPLGIPETLPALFLVGLTGEPYGELLWVRRQNDSLLWGGTYKVHPRDAFVGGTVPGRLDDVPIDGMLHMQALAARAARYMPVLTRYRSLTLKHGAPCYTPDHRALIGPVPGIEGMYAMTGDCESGVTHGPGFAKALADHIVDGSSNLTSIGAWRIDRFNGRYTHDAEVAEAIAQLRQRRILADTATSR